MEPCPGEPLDFPLDFLDGSIQLFDVNFILLFIFITVLSLISPEK